MSDAVENLNELEEKILNLEAELQKEQEKAKEHWDKVLRLQADLQNSFKRAEKDVEHAHRYSIEKFAKDMLQVVDSLELALNNKTEENAFAEGVTLTCTLLHNIFDRFQIKKMDAEGKKFDPLLHEAILMQESEAEEGTILTVVQHGYMLQERILRPARVIVAKVKNLN